MSVQLAARPEAPMRQASSVSNPRSEAGSLVPDDVEVQQESDEEDGGDEPQTPSGPSQPDGAPWFHGPLGRDGAEQVLAAAPNLEDGDFLVRESTAFAGEYSLSFYHDGEPWHARIRLVDEGYFVTIVRVMMKFPTLHDLVAHYQVFNVIITYWFFF